MLFNNKACGLSSSKSAMEIHSVSNWSEGAVLSFYPTSIDKLHYWLSF